MPPAPRAAVGATPPVPMPERTAGLARASFSRSTASTAPAGPVAP
ncbi:hypothetical protein [Streptomyces gelaticus]|nr:hypothetical protein [Streptomyces gelaticus]